MDWVGVPVPVDPQPCPLEVVELPGVSEAHKDLVGWMRPEDGSIGPRLEY